MDKTEDGSKKQRKVYLDVCKGFAILCVVFAHTSGNNHVGLWFSSFLMIIFFFVSGIIIDAKWKNTVTFGEYFIKCVQTILFPYLLFSVIGGAIAIIYGRTLYMFLWVIYNTVTLRGYSTLWFLPAFFFGKLILYPILNSKRSSLCAAISAVGGMALMAVCCYLYPYMVNLFGTVVEGEQTVLDAGDLVSSPFLTIAHAAAAIAFLPMGVLTYRFILKKTGERNVVALIIAAVVFIGCSVLAMFNPGIDINNAMLGERVYLFFVTGIGLSVSILILVRFVCSFAYKFPVLSWLGKNSFIIMCTHQPCYIVLFIKLMFENIRGAASPTEESVKYYLYYFAVVACIMAIEVGIIFLINKFCPWMMGKFKKKSPDEKSGEKSS